MKKDKPLSENIQTYEAGNYIVTAAVRINLYDHYEIGVRDKAVCGNFTLIQNSKFNYQSVQEVANAIAHLLSLSTEHYTPEWCQEWFGES